MMLRDDYSEWTRRTGLDVNQSGIYRDWLFERRWDAPDGDGEWEEFDCSPGGQITVDASSAGTITASLPLAGGSVEPGMSVRCTCYTCDPANRLYRDDVAFELHADASQRDEVHGSCAGDINLYGDVGKAMGDKRGADLQVPAGTNIVDWFERICEDGNIEPVETGIGPTMASMAFAQPHTWAYGESLWDEIKRCAEALNAGAGAYYQGKGINLYLWDPTEGSSVEFGTLCERLTFTPPKPVNRMIGRMKVGDGEATVDVRLDPDHPWSFANTGCWWTEEFGSDAALTGLSTRFEQWRADAALDFVFIEEYVQTDQGVDWKRIRCAANNMYLNFNPDNNAVGLKVSDGTGNQQWKAVSRADGCFYLSPRSAPNLILAINAQGGTYCAASGAWLRANSYGNYQLSYLNSANNAALRASSDIADAFRGNVKAELDRRAASGGTVAFRAPYEPGLWPNMRVHIDYDDGGTRFDGYGRISKMITTLDDAGYTEYEVILDGEQQQD